MFTAAPVWMSMMLARDVASLVVMSEPVPALPEAPPSAEGAFQARGVLVSCGVTWTVPVEGTPTAVVDADCPAEHREAVEAAAMAWSFAAVTPREGQDTVSVRRWMVLSADAQGLSWKARTADPSQAPMPRGCLRTTRFSEPPLPWSFNGDIEQCKVTFTLDERRRRAAQVEASGCANVASLAALESAEGWHFSVCDAWTEDTVVVNAQMTLKRR